MLTAKPKQKAPIIVPDVRALSIHRVTKGIKKTNGIPQARDQLTRPAFPLQPQQLVHPYDKLKHQPVIIAAVLDIAAVRGDLVQQSIKEIIPADPPPAAGIMSIRQHNSSRHQCGCFTQQMVIPL